MKKRLCGILLALALTVSLAVPASAFESSSVSTPNVVSCGADHMAMVQGGSLWLWGCNISGQLGNGETAYRTEIFRLMDGVSAVSCGDGFTAAVKTDGSLWTWGINSSGSLGYAGGNATNESNNPIQTVPVKIMDGVAAVSCGGKFIAAIKTDGSLWTWGINGNGALGDGTKENRIQPKKIMDGVAAVSCGDWHMAALKTDGSLWTWGSNIYGQLGYSDTNAKNAGGTNVQTQPRKVMDGVKTMCCGNAHTAAVKTDGTLWTWGLNNNGQLAGTTTSAFSYKPVQVLDGVAAVCCGYRDTMALKADGSLWAWGYNANGQLGLENVDTMTVTPQKVMEGVKSVNCGNAHTAVVKTDGTLWTWGFNGNGQLGYEGGSGAVNTGGVSSSVMMQKKPRQVTNLTAPADVTLVLNGGSGAKSLATNSMGRVSAPQNPTRSGYYFGGWYKDAGLSEMWDFDDSVTAGLTLYARWIPLSSTASETSERSTVITVDGKPVTLQTFVLRADSNGGDVNYVKLRDIAALLNGTASQYNVDWVDGSIYIAKRTAYTTQNGTELQPIIGAGAGYKLNTAPVLFGGVVAPLEGIVKTDGKGGGHTYFKLRDLGAAAGFTVDWSAEKGVTITTG